MLPLVLAVLGLVAGRAAAEGVHLRWDDCAGEGGARNRDFACNGSAGSDVLVASFVLDQPMEQFVAIEGEILVCSHEPLITDWPCEALPDWWRLEAGGCRAGSVSLSTDFDVPPWSGARRCTNPWVGVSESAVYVPPGGGALTQIWFWGLRSEAIRLEPGTEYYAVRLTIDHAKATGETTCEGCCREVFPYFGRLRLVGGDSSSLTLFGYDYGSYAAWQSGGTPCGATPVRGTRWGQLKVLYR